MHCTSIVILTVNNDCNGNYLQVMIVMVMIMRSNAMHKPLCGTYYSHCAILPALFVLF